MREIKFRAWVYNYNKKEHKMDYAPFVYDDECLAEYSMVNLNEALANGGDACNVIEYKSIFMQYTGLKDKNGKEIYKGDIISADFDGEEMLFEVAWNENAMAWDIKDKNGVFYFDIYENGSPFKFLKNIKVIGNIYENPELLGGE